MNELSFNVRLISVGGFSFKQEGKEYRLDIKDDITALESANISVLLSQAATINYSANYAWIDFINEKQIGRHFKDNKDLAADKAKED